MMQMIIDRTLTTIWMDERINPSKHPPNVPIIGRRKRTAIPSLLSNYNFRNGHRNRNQRLNYIQLIYYFLIILKLSELQLLVSATITITSPNNRLSIVTQPYRIHRSNTQNTLLQMIIANRYQINRNARAILDESGMNIHDNDLYRLSPNIRNDAVDYGGKDDRNNVISSISHVVNNVADKGYGMGSDGVGDIDVEGDRSEENSDIFHNKSAKGMYIGAVCDNYCDSKLKHVSCDENTRTCTCDRYYPVVIGRMKGCAQPKKLGEQCFYDITCAHNDINSLCIQVKHNALCQCINGYHSVTYIKPTKRVFCTQDMDTLQSDLPTLLGVTTGIAVLAGLICMVLHLFSKNRYPRHRNYATTHLSPPILYSTDTVQSVRPASRSSMRSSNSNSSFENRRSSYGQRTPGPKGILMSTSRSGSRRPSLASVHSSSSVKSYSIMRFEKELLDKEMRFESKMKLARIQQRQQQQSQSKLYIEVYHPLGLSISKSAIISGGYNTILNSSSGASGSQLNQLSSRRNLYSTTPSPITPKSTDELLPAVDENEVFTSADNPN